LQNKKIAYDFLGDADRLQKLVGKTLSAFLKTQNKKTEFSKPISGTDFKFMKIGSQNTYICISEPRAFEIPAHSDKETPI
jgi:hypothetical protein